MSHRNKAILTFAVTVTFLTGSCGQPTPLPDQAGVPELISSPTPEIRAVPGISKDLVRRLIEDINANKNNFRLSAEDLEVVYENLKRELHDLNNDGLPEYFLYIDHSDWCGAGGNCTYWVYRKADGTFDLILEDKVLKPQNSVTNGYRDLWSESPMGFCEPYVWRIFVTRYKFDGIKYQKQGDEYDCRPASRRKTTN